MSIEKPKFETVQEYLDKAPAVSRPHLVELRELIREAAPQAEEMIRYDMPGYYQQGRPVVYFSAAKAHATLHIGGEPLQVLKEQLTSFTTTRGGVHFPYAKPLPRELIRRLMACRLAQRETESHR